MKTKTYLEFKEIEKRGLKTKMFQVFNKDGEYLGLIAFKPEWRRYIFQPNGPGLLFDAGCMKEIVQKIEAEQLKWKASWKGKSNGRQLRNVR